LGEKGGGLNPPLIVVLFVFSRMNNFSAIWRPSPLPVTGLQN
jgi:hypothetical protein